MRNSELNELYTKWCRKLTIKNGHTKADFKSKTLGIASQYVNKSPIKFLHKSNFSISFGTYLVRRTQNMDNEDSLGNLMQLCGCPRSCVIITATCAHLLYSDQKLYENKKYQLVVSTSICTSHRVRKEKYLMLPKHARNYLFWNRVSKLLILFWLLYMISWTI